jgi:toxin ParE1/3/4
VVPAHLRAAAQRDVEEAVAYYREEAGLEVALDFVDSLEAAISDLQHHPLIGSLRFAFELEIPDLRGWPVERFPYIVFYVSDDETIDIWRVLHTKRDIPTFLSADLPS